MNENQIGVDLRYAARKWREPTLDARPEEQVAVARGDELEVDQMKLLRVGDGRILLGRTEHGCVAQGGSSCRPLDSELRSA